MRYELLFTIECLHGYFADHLCKVLTLAPTGDCRRLLGRYQMIFRALPNGGAVYFDASDEIDYLKIFQEKRPFTFSLISSDASLGNYTAQASDGSVSPADGIFYFNNLRGQSAEVYGEPKLLLHAPQRATVPLTVQSRQFVYVSAQPLTGAQLEVTDLSGLQASWKNKSPMQTSVNLPIDLSGYADGAYRLSVDGKDVFDFYVSDTPAVRQWGIVEIFAGGAAADYVPDAFRVIDADGRPQPKTFTISLDSRQTIWRYCVISQAPQERKYDTYDVIGTNKKSSDGDAQSSSEIRFTRMPDPLTINGKQAVVFESIAGIPLLQVPAQTHTFTLMPGTETQRGARSYKLPYPAVDALVAGDASGGVFSAVYVYL
jgi:hypothetical protein